MRHLLIALLAFLLFLLLVTHATSYGWGADPSLYAIPKEPVVEVPKKSPIPLMAPRKPFSFNTLYDGRTQRTVKPRQVISLSTEEKLEQQLIRSGDNNSIGNIRQWDQPARQVYDPLRGTNRMSLNPVERAMINQGYDVAGKLPILPQKRDASITDAAGNVLPSSNPLRNIDVPILGNQKTTRNLLERNRLSPTERTEQQLYRGPSRPGMIAPRAQQERYVPPPLDRGR
ncbi:hypothetical protein DTL42_25750 [Bremerella cremea]|uniref:Uncharacterized protein n=1 Tax=Bremerella cremea TaxID=1031537 RepID=A0A368KJU9_9BACT|nr:hypothetical protein [Bremerella cremea]RCS40769.1 hypothetical protein DTL42_25750 [Bremerella cremea]